MKFLISSSPEQRRSSCADTIQLQFFAQADEVDGLDAKMRNLVTAVGIGGMILLLEIACAAIVHIGC